MGDSTNGITFEEPPQPRKGGGSVLHAQAAAALRARPGQWARIGTYSNSGSASSMVQTIRMARTRAYEPAGAFEAVSRTVKGVHGVWARYKGGETP